MGIYDARWIDNASFVTCSADNTIKLWSVTEEGQVELKNTFLQHEGKKDTAYQLLGMAEQNQNLTAVNLSGDLVHYQKVTTASQGHPTYVARGHNYLISDMISFDKFVVYGTETRICYFDANSPKDIHHIQGLPSKQNILEFYSNHHSLYATTLDKFVLRFTALADGTLQLAKSLDLKSAAAKSIGAGVDVIYVLRSNGEIDELDAVDLTLKRSHKHGLDPTCMTYSEASKELWLGDKKGLLSILSTVDFSLVHKIDKHTKTITVLTCSHDGS